ncbi:MAG: Thioesterase superfamily protein [Methanoregulaceae archaeon PtaB.Bin056]|nr:MAG: Thioesterase superfamily protein [Methanoregulaceae archaeon PtaB.Bin056]
MSSLHPTDPNHLSPADVHEKVRNFNQSEFARLLEMEILEARPGYARVRMDSDGKRNLRGFAHGGAIFALADQAFGIAANLGGVDEVALSAQIFYLAPAKGILTAIAECTGETAQYSSYTVRVFRDDMLVATFEGQGKKQHR